jgi:hypothetical protein
MILPLSRVWPLCNQPFITASYIIIQAISIFHLTSYKCPSMHHHRSHFFLSNLRFPTPTPASSSLQVWVFSCPYSPSIPPIIRPVRTIGQSHQIITSFAPLKARFYYKVGIVKKTSGKTLKCLQSWVAAWYSAMQNKYKGKSSTS